MISASWESDFTESPGPTAQIQGCLVDEASTELWLWSPVQFLQMMSAVIIEFSRLEDCIVRWTLGRGDGVSWPLGNVQS